MIRIKPEERRLVRFRRWLLAGTPFGYSWKNLLLQPHVLLRNVRDEVTYAYQRMVHGYDKPATYNVNSHLAQQIPDLLRELKSWGNGYPPIPGWHSHALVLDEEEKKESEGLKKWHAVLDEIIAGFEAYLAMDDCPAWDEFFDEWAKRYPGVDGHYFDEDTRTEDGSVQMKTHPAYDALREELKVMERDKQWKKDKMKVFHNGMIQFHRHFMDLWD